MLNLRFIKIPEHFPSRSCGKNIFFSSIIMITTGRFAWACELNNLPLIQELISLWLNWNPASEKKKCGWNVWDEHRKSQRERARERENRQKKKLESFLNLKSLKELANRAHSLFCRRYSACAAWLVSPLSFFFLVLSRWSLSMMRTCLSLARSLMKACRSRASVVGRCRWFFTRERSTNDKKRFDLLCGKQRGAESLSQNTSDISKIPTKYFCYFGRSWTGHVMSASMRLLLYISRSEKPPHESDKTS